MSERASLRLLISKTDDEDIKAKINKARQTFAMHKPLWKSNVLSENTKIRILMLNQCCSTDMKPGD